MLKNKYTLIALLILGSIYLILISSSTKGYGYAGYGGYHNGPSVWYTGGANYYKGEKSVRDRSLSGPRSTGGGFSGGK